MEDNVFRMRVNSFFCDACDLQVLRYRASPVPKNFKCTSYVFAKSIVVDAVCLDCYLINRDK